MELADINVTIHAQELIEEMRNIQLLLLLLAISLQFTLAAYILKATNSRSIFALLVILFSVFDILVFLILEGYV